MNTYDLVFEMKNGKSVKASIKEESLVDEVQRIFKGDFYSIFYGDDSNSESIVVNIKEVASLRAIRREVCKKKK